MACDREFQYVPQSYRQITTSGANPIFPHLTRSDVSGTVLL